MPKLASRRRRFQFRLRMRFQASFVCRRLLSCSARLMLCSLLPTIVAIATESSEKKFVPLFPDDGAPKGWTARQWDDVSKPVDAKWNVNNGILHASQRGNWLMSEKEYGDFELAFEFKLGALGNSGCALRAPLKGDPAFDGMELQMADLRYNTSAKESELTGGIYRAIKPKKQVYRPTEWNKMEIKLVGDRLKATLNGELIQDVNLAEESDQVKRHDGSDAPAVKDRPRRGHLGFQELSRGDDHVQIRNAMIKVLD
jgi:hypothetical protein